jgi:ribose transport system ATP-binding protein
MEHEVIFEVKNCTKRFGPTTALNHVNFTIRRGEITGLIGENGSGKSTLSAIMTGIYSRNEGEMFFKGKPWEPKSMIWSMNNGIGIIVQEKGTIANITVAENIFLGEASKFAMFKTKKGTYWGPIIRKRMNDAADQVLKEMGETKFHGATPINLVNFQDQKLIEIAKVIAKKPEILIVDETSTALSQHGRDILYSLIHKMRSENKAVVFISHDLDEIMEQCDTLTVLRDGNIIRTFDKEKGEYNPDKIKESMIGRELKGDYYRSDYDGTVDESKVVLSMKHAVAGNIFKDFNLKLHKGEILGIGGLSECGMHEVGKALFGAIPLDAGSVYGYKKEINKKTNKEEIKGYPISSPEKAIEFGIGYASKDRDIESLNLNAPIKDNIAIAGLDKFATAKFFINPKNETKYVKKQADFLSIKCASVDQYVSALSGGNKQKVAFAKWIGKDCDILILDCPTRGVDIGVKQSMYQLMYGLKKQGKSIIMISEELAELIGMSDTLAIIKDGKLTKTFKRSKDLSESEIIKYMI